MIVLIPASKVLQPAIEPIQCTTSFNNIKQIQYYYRLLINGSPSSMCVYWGGGGCCAWARVCLHTLYYVPSYTLQGAWLLLGVRVSNVQKARPSAHSQKLCDTCDALW